MSEKLAVGICGYGWVGKAMHQLFPDANVYDAEIKPYCSVDHEQTCFDSKIIFICVPTPNLRDGSLDTSIVRECVRKCPHDALIVIRSTVNPGTCRELEDLRRRICMQPEYLGETPAHPLLDQRSRPFLIIGGEQEDRHELISLYMTVYNANIDIRQVTNYEAEVIKLSENRAIAFKVAQCQELYDVCEAAGVDYYTIRDAVYGDDPRFNLWWTAIYPNKRGFNSKCIPKDVFAWKAWAESVGVFPIATAGVLDANAKLIGIDGPCKQNEGILE